MEIIRPHRSFFDLNLKEVWNYRDLLFMFVRRDFASQYKQTILGPLWFFIQPLLTTIMFVIVFGNIGKISTDGMPKTLFYLSGLTIWNYFSECFNRTSTVFITNAPIFGKVYFPRLISPLSIVISGLIKFSVQFILFLGFFFYYIWALPDTINPRYEYFFFFPILLVMMAGFALSLGMIISSLTTKYRDLTHLVSFGVTLLMYATPVIYPTSTLPQKYQYILHINPLAPVVEMFRNVFLGTGTIDLSQILISFSVLIILLLVAVLTFNRVQRKFMDTV